MYHAILNYSHLLLSREFIISSVVILDLPPKEIQQTLDNISSSNCVKSLILIFRRSKLKPVQVAIIQVSLFWTINPILKIHRDIKGHILDMVPGKKSSRTALYSGRIISYVLHPNCKLLDCSFTCLAT